MTSGSLPSASDCLFILRAAVGADTCEPPCICAPTGSSQISATDSLVCLKKAVDESVVLACPCGGTTTTTTTVPSGANIVIVNLDGSNEGFNDKSARSPVGGNRGTTLGAQRLFVFQHAANIWGTVLPSGAVILVQAKFDPMFCTSSSAVLGSGGPATVWRDFANAPVPGHWYHVSLANRLAATDLHAGDDLVLTFNSSLGDASCMPAGWYWPRRSYRRSRPHPC